MKEGLEKDTKKLDSVSVKDGETNSEIGKKKGKEERPPTKVVVRRLPPSMTEEEFLQQIEPIPPVDYMYYVPADLSLSPHAFCRAYLNFINQSDIFIFTQKFDGYVFLDAKGLEYPAVVEFAPFQRIPKQRPGRKKDPKAGTLETDPTYISFLEKLNAQIQENTTTGSNIKQHFFETNVALSMIDDNKICSTPLLDYLRARHAERLRAREEKRKKDLERKRARDEQRRSAKKSEEEQTVVKVLPTQNSSSSSSNSTSVTSTSTITSNVTTATSTNKDKFKEKDVVKPKKRSDERLKETKGRIGKSYAEERQKHLEKREEQKKKFASSSLNSKPSKPTKLFSDQKPSEQNSLESDKSQDSESKKTESEPKASDDVFKGSTGEKKGYQHKYSQESQKHFDRSKRDDGFNRRSKDNEIFNNPRAQYHDRRVDRDNMKKKIINAFKKSYSRYDDSNKDNKYKKEGQADNRPFKKVDNETKSEKVVSDSAIDAKEKEIKKDVIEIKQKASDVESAVKENDSTEDCSGKNPEPNKNNEDLKEKNEALSVKNLETESELSNNSEETSVNYELLKKSLLESSEKNLSRSDGKTECDNISEIDHKTQAISLESPSVPVENSSIVDTENPGNPSVDQICEENDSVKLTLSEKEDSVPPTEKCYTSESSSDSGKGNENDFNSNTGNQEFGEILLKRRNSMEMYNRKDRISEKNNCRENVRRSSLESGDQRKNCLQLDPEINDKKKSDGDHLESKPKDPRTGRRIRNKDRPTMEIYRPGMGRLSKQRMERDKVLGSSTEVDSNSTSPSPTLIPKHKSLTNHNRES